MEIVGDDDESFTVSSLFNDDVDDVEVGDTDKINADRTLLKKTITLLQSQGSSRLSYKTKSVQGTSRKISDVWTKFTQVCLDEKPQCIWKCNKCPSLFMCNLSTGNTHMNRHKCNSKNAPSTSASSAAASTKITKFLAKEVPQQSIRELNKDITIGLAKDLQPLYRSETEGFRYMAQRLIDFGARYGSSSKRYPASHNFEAYSPSSSLF